MNAGTCVVNCKCSHEFQDRRYGANRRVANATQKSSDKNGHRVDVRCTVCKTLHTVNESQLRK